MPEPKRKQDYPWTDDEIAIVRTMKAAGNTASDIQGALPSRGVAGIESLCTRLQIRSPSGKRWPNTRPVAHYAPPEGPMLAEVLAPDASRDETDEEFLARFLTISRRTVAKAQAQKYATIKIASDVPIALCISSDWHIGTECDMDALLAMAKLVATTPGMYALVVGDQTNNPIKHRGGNVGAVPDELRALELTVQTFLGKILGWTDGNHDAWTRDFAGIDVMKWMSQKHRIHYAPDEMLYTVQIVSPHDPEQITAEYVIATRHQWRRHSNLNPTHACKTWLQEQQMNWEQIPDVLALGHNHTAAIGSEQYSGKDVHYLRMGSFQRDSSYARAKGFADYRPTAPTVVLPPTRAQRIACFADPADAIQHMRGWRDVAS